MMDGFGFVQAVRADADFAGLRVMMVTGEEEQAQADRALQAGADAYLAKPFTRDVIFQKLQELGLCPCQTS